jgi:putative ubiquitin-RnfH superfamily antitoxin RatB of RatAB toxin-antitoxin module
MAEMLGISVCYASAEVEWLHPMRVEAGTTIGEAIERSGVLEAFPDINLTTQPVGIYAKKKTLDTVLRARGQARGRGQRERRRRLSVALEAQGVISCAIATIG